MFDLTDKVAIVTGSSRGIGRAIAELFAQAGAKVVVSSRTEEACAPVVAAIEAAGGTAVAIPCHIGRREALQALVDQTLDLWGRIDVLVCNAAINPVYGPMAGISDEAFDKIMVTNVRSTLNLCNMVLPGMAERGAGSVILLSSIAGIRGSTDIGAYGVSKAAEAALARNLALEWGPKGIRVNAIAPGLIKTDFARALWEDPKRIASIENATPLRRIGAPEEIAGTALWLATPAAGYVTGQTIVADGGETIR
ncbi:SDR family NAD(P)-dependent oxidoreductase [Pseudooceanicola nanhaiensis]|uniref:SDR family NAD(P)-dependent oxidoreductase n=1 Tax=Pseudooceanicola nanhaiensis TaxID=375761 RepID=UPI001CD444F1|nr:SDR family oxidoreductase [Pseudooceanicola nanhaiensis]MCA0921472.1 SDR family oxidoreductase [Pseudooceanicola nanhaiensis]